MSRITVQTHVTLDGVIESPPEALLPYMSDEGRQATLELALASDALLLGRMTWQRLAPAWRKQTGPVAEWLNAMPKYVVTSTLGSAIGWGNSELIGYGEMLPQARDLVCRPPAGAAQDGQHAGQRLEWSPATAPSTRPSSVASGSLTGAAVRILGLHRVSQRSARRPECCQAARPEDR